MHIAEVVTIAKSLPLLRLNTYKSLILSYSADYRRIFEKNTTPVSYEQYIKNYWRKGSQFITDETFIKLREVSITYDIPKSFSKKCRLSSSSVSLIGQNLLLWTKDYKFADPDRATDDLNSPSVRYVGVNLKLEF